MGRGRVHTRKPRGKARVPVDTRRYRPGCATPHRGFLVRTRRATDDRARPLPIVRQPPSRVVVNNAESYIACCLAGLGLIQIPRFDVQHLLDSGELVEVMPAYRATSMPVSLLYPHRRQRSRRLAVFLEWFEALMKAHPDA